MSEAEPIEPVDEGEPAPEPAEAPKGYQTKEQWEESGNDPADYVTEEVFNARGDLIRQSKRQQRRIDELENRLNSQSQDYEGRLENQARLSAIGLDSQRTDLQAKLEEAIDLGDRDKALSIQGNIDKLNPVIDSLKEPTPKPAATPQGKDPAITEWEDNNPWIMGETPKAAYTHAIYAKFKREMAGTTGVVDYPALLKQVDADLAKEFPETNPRRNAPRTAEAGSPAGKAKAAALKESDFTAEEKSYIKNYGWEVAPDGKGGVDMKKMTTMIERSRA